MGTKSKQGKRKCQSILKTFLKLFKEGRKVL